MLIIAKAQQWEEEDTKEGEPKSKPDTSPKRSSYPHESYTARIAVTGINTGATTTMHSPRSEA